MQSLLYEFKLPGQYIGGELNSVVKSADKVSGSVCLCFPDLYTIGMSNYGLQLLYHLVNERSGWACERCFMPMPDREAALRQHNSPLTSLETHSPLNQFDVLGFSLQYELCYTNVLAMLSLGKVPLRCNERTLSDPLVIAGGPSAVNPEPMSDFIDAFVIGDGEEALQQVCDAWGELKSSAKNRSDALNELSNRFTFLAVPSLTGFRKKMVCPAVVADIGRYEPPLKRILPWVECVQDRVAVEIMRGCPGRCNFCVSSVMKRGTGKLRCRKPEDIVRIAYESCLQTGSNEVSLLSLSTSDYPHFDELMTALKEKLHPLNISISVPSLRVNHQLSAAAASLTTDKSSGLTLAPEAALEPMRQRIGKPILTDDLLSGCEAAFRNGFNRVKMYFMCGLPEETPEDWDGIIDLSYQVAKIGRSIRKKPVTITANVSNFVPKPHTAWERRGMQTDYYFLTAHDHLKTRVRHTGVALKYHSLETSLLEGLLSRGDRNVGKVIERAWQLGARLDSWTDYFRPDIWEQAIHEQGIDVPRIVHTDIPAETELPWGYIRF